MKNNHLYVLGTGYSHDGSACLLKDGKICVAIEKERITRKKHDGFNDTAAIEYCLNAEGIALKDVDLVVQNGAALAPVTDYFQGERLFMPNVDVPLHSISHHLAHAYSTIGTCPFESNYNILVIDGMGSSYDQCIDLPNDVPDKALMQRLPHVFYEKDSYYRYEDNRLTSVFKDFSELGYIFKDWEKYTGNKHSIGGVYEMFSKYCFGNIADTGKLMGLGPYGNTGVFKAPLFQFREGRVFVDYETIDAFQRPTRSYATFRENFQYYADVARWVQQEVEEAVLYTLKSRLEQSYAENLCYAGGVALNAVANAKILDRFKIKRLYMQPAAGDNGVAIGCAYYGWLEILKKERVKHNQSTFFGKSYGEQEVLDALRGFGVHEPLEIKATIDDFFSQLKSYNKEFTLAGSTLQINLPDVGIYQMEFTEEAVTVNYGLRTPPTSTLSVDGQSFLKGIADTSYFSRLFNEGKLKTSNIVEMDMIFKAINWPVLFQQQVNLLNGEKSFSPFTFRKSVDIAADTAALLARGKVIALFQGGAEFGPRALGHRSIIADPRIPGIRDFINTRIKLREDFRPFAPAVLEEDLMVYFKNSQESPYMILVNEIRQEWQAPLASIAHKNNSSRVQTVTRDWNSRFYDLIVAFKAITGLSVLLNTSFNRKGMPIVETPQQALEFFAVSELDYLVAEDYIIEKTPADAVRTGASATEVYLPQ